MKPPPKSSGAGKDADTRPTEAAPGKADTRPTDTRPTEAASGESHTASELSNLSPEQLLERLGETLERLSESEARAEEHLEMARRVQAEFENYRKRMLREQTDAIARSGKAMALNLLPVLDDFEIALDAAGSTDGANERGILKGMELVYSKLREVLEKEGVERFANPGDLFDPSIHEAVSQDDSGSEDGDLAIAEVYRPGYKFKGELLRPAMVTLTRGGGGDES